MKKQEIQCKDCRAPLIPNELKVQLFNLNYRFIRTKLSIRLRFKCAHKIHLTTRFATDKFATKIDKLIFCCNQ